jgi:hypothetical protein
MQQVRKVVFFLRIGSLSEKIHFIIIILLLVIYYGSFCF